MGVQHQYNKWADDVQSPKFSPMQVNPGPPMGSRTAQATLSLRTEERGVKINSRNMHEGCQTSDLIDLKKAESGSR